MKNLKHKASNKIIYDCVFKKIHNPHYLVTQIGSTDDALCSTILLDASHRRSAARLKLAVDTGSTQPCRCIVSAMCAAADEAIASSARTISIAVENRRGTSEAYF